MTNRKLTFRLADDIISAYTKVDRDGSGVNGTDIKDALCLVDPRLYLVIIHIDSKFIGGLV